MNTLLQLIAQIIFIQSGTQATILLTLGVCALFAQWNIQYKRFLLWMGSEKLVVLHLVWNFPNNITTYFTIGRVSCPYR